MKSVLAPGQASGELGRSAKKKLTFHHLNPTELAPKKETMKPPANSKASYVVKCFSILAALWVPIPAAQAQRIESVHLEDPVIEAQSVTGYHKKVIQNGVNDYEQRLFLDDHHFGSILDKNDVIAFRPHPGMDLDGWGCTLYLHPFLALSEPGRGTVVVTPGPDGIGVSVTGDVNSASGDAGDFAITLNFQFNEGTRSITGVGSYTVTLASLLTSQDLDLYRLASNMLENVPLLTGGTGVTGDSEPLTFTLGTYSTTWDPLTSIWNPFYYGFGDDAGSRLHISLPGLHNLVDTVRQDRDPRQEPINRAYKPSIEVEIATTDSTDIVMFGGSLDTSTDPVTGIVQSENAYADNLGVHAIINRAIQRTGFSFDLNISSTPIPGDNKGMLAAFMASGLDGPYAGIGYSDDLENWSRMGTIARDPDGMYRDTIKIPHAPKAFLNAINEH